MLGEGIGENVKIDNFGVRSNARGEGGDCWERGVGENVKIGKVGI